MCCIEISIDYFLHSDSTPIDDWNWGDFELERNGREGKGDVYAVVTMLVLTEFMRIVGLR